MLNQILKPEIISTERDLEEKVKKVNKKYVKNNKGFSII